MGCYWNTGDLRTEGLGTAPICYDWNHCFCERERSSQCCDRRRHAWEALRMGCRVPGHDSVVDGSTREDARRKSGGYGNVVRSSRKPERASGMCTGCTGQSATSKGVHSSARRLGGARRSDACEPVTRLRTRPLWPFLRFPRLPFDLGTAPSVLSA